MATTKVCTRCNKRQPLTQFNKSSKYKSGIMPTCRDCRKEYYRHPKGLSYTLHYRQIQSSKIRSYGPPAYSKDELYEWLQEHPDFMRIYKRWVRSGYKRKMAVSIDRLDDYKGYSFDNIRLTTWSDNKKKADRDSKLGINNKRSCKVSAYDKKTGAYKGTWYSQSEAARQLGLDQPSISACILGKIKTSGGYIWKEEQPADRDKNSLHNQHRTKYRPDDT